MDEQDMVDAYCAAFDKAWKGPDEWESEQLVFRSSGGMVPVLFPSHNGTGLAPPFSKGISLGWHSTTPPEHAAEIVLLAMEPKGRLHDILDRGKRKLEELCDGAGMELLDWHVHSVEALKDGGIGMTLSSSIRALNASGVPQVDPHLTGDGTFGWHGMKKLRVLARKQNERRSLKDRPLQADPVLAPALNRLDPIALLRLIGHLSLHPQVPAEQMGLAQQAGWTKASLGRYGLTMPDDVETLLVKKGVVTGRMRLGPKTTWCDGTLVHGATTLPEAVVGTLVGRDLRDVMVHEMIPPGIVIRKCVIDKRGALRITTRYDLTDVKVA